MEKNIYLVEDIVGCCVYTNDKKLGIVTSILKTGANDVYIIKSDENKEILIPATKQVVKQIDIEQKTIVINLIPGLVDEN